MLAVAIAAFAIWRRRDAAQRRRADPARWSRSGSRSSPATEIPDALLSAFSFERENGTRIVGVAMFAILILFLLTLRALAQSSRITRELGGVLEGLAWEQFRAAGHPERFRDRIAILVPAYNEADNIGSVLERHPGRGLRRADRGARRRRRLARRHRRGRRARTGRSSPATSINRGGGAALRTGYRLLADSGAQIVVTLDADGQHLPEEMPRLVQPVLDGEVAVAHGSRVLGEAERNHPAREAGIVFFNRLVSFITRTHVTDCSNGYRAVRADVLPTLVLRQEQFHTSEFMIEAIKRGIPAKEVPVTVVGRLSGHSKKPAVVRYGMGFANAIVRTWLR